MGVIETRTFKSGNSIAVCLPHELGLAADTAVLIEHDGDTIIIRPVNDPKDGRRRVQELVAALRALGPVGEVEKRDADIFPDRPGL